MMTAQWISLVVIVAGVAMGEVDNTRKLYNGFQVQRWETLVLDDFQLLYQLCISFCILLHKNKIIITSRIIFVTTR